MQKKYFLALITIISLLTLVSCAGLGEPPEKSGEKTTGVEDANDADDVGEVEDADETGEVEDAEGEDEDEAGDVEEEPVADESATVVPHEIFISGSEFKYSPSSISLTAGESVKITFQNDGKYPHDFAIEGLNVKTAVIGAGEQAVLEFTAPATGNYTTYCSVAGHREAGMEGSVSVQ